MICTPNILVAANESLFADTTAEEALTRPDRAPDTGLVLEKLHSRRFDSQGYVMLFSA